MKSNLENKIELGNGFEDKSDIRREYEKKEEKRVLFEKMIEDKFNNCEIHDQEDLREFIEKIKGFLREYECDYGMERENMKKINEWQRRLFRIIRENKNVPEEIEKSEKEGIEVVKMVNRQIQQAGANQKLLETTTLKLIGLDYSCDDIEKAIEETNNKINISKLNEKNERIKIRIAFSVFVFVCFYIILDRIFFVK